MKVEGQYICIVTHYHTVEQSQQTQQQLYYYIAQYHAINNIAVDGNGGAVHVDIRRYGLSSNSSVVRCHFINSTAGGSGGNQEVMTALICMEISTIKTLVILVELSIFLIQIHPSAGFHPCRGNHIWGEAPGNGCGFTCFFIETQYLIM